MKYIFFLLLFSRLAANDLEEMQQISFYRGYTLWKECLDRPAMPYDFEQVINGMRAAENKEPLTFSEEDLQPKLRQFQESLLAKQIKENLEAAEKQLAKIAKENVVEVVRDKLYFKQLKKGGGKIVQKDSTPLLTYSLYTFDPSGERESFSSETPRPITLADTITGFSLGVAGMQEGEIRQIYIHPDLAYGTYGKLDPNVLVSFKVEVIRADDQADKP